MGKINKHADGRIDIVSCRIRKLFSAQNKMNLKYARKVRAVHSDLESVTFVVSFILTVIDRLISPSGNRTCTFLKSRRRTAVLSDFCGLVMSLSIIYRKVHQNRIPYDSITTYTNLSLTVITSCLFKPNAVDQAGRCTGTALDLYSESCPSDSLLRYRLSFVVFLSHSREMPG